MIDGPADSRPSRRMPMPRTGLLALVVLTALAAGCGFVGSEPIVEPPGFFGGLWHGLLAPWTLLLRIALEIQMYAVPNAGWFYDLGFLLGLTVSLPLGWIAAIVAFFVHVF
jgi:hypothetical protein